MKRKSSLKIVATLLAVALCFGTSGCSTLFNLFSKDSWDISNGGSSKVKAELVEGQNSDCVLKISGTGYMKSFENASQTPWAKKVSKISKVEISEGVKSIGAYAFAGIDVDSVVLPESMQVVRSHAVDEDVALFALAEGVEREEDVQAKIYTYMEEMPETDDRFWQSDMSKEDIIGDEEIEAEEEGLFWHYDRTGNAEIFEKIKILFIGNSFTYRNGRVDFSSGVPGIFDQVAEDLGYWVETYSVTGPGWYLENHAKATDTCGAQTEKLLNAYNDFDYVVLQEQSTNPFENYNRFLNGVKAMQAKIESTQDHAKIYLYETWGSPYSANERNITVAEMEAKLLDAYNRAGEECGLDVSYVGQAFTDIYEHNKSINLYDTDNRHQGYTGAYLSACVHVGTILGGDVRETTFIGEEKYNAPILSESVLTALRTSAYNVAFGVEVEDGGEDNTPQKPDYSLEIAIWGRWITETQFVTVYEGFKQYCAANEIDASNVHYTYYTGKVNTDPYYYIADFTGAVVGSGGADIVFPCATNLTTQTGTHISSAEITPLNITLNGRTDRCIAKLTDTELSEAFYNYCLSDEGKTLLDPTH